MQKFAVQISDYCSWLNDELYPGSDSGTKWTVMQHECQQAAAHQWSDGEATDTLALALWVRYFTVEVETLCLTKCHSRQN